jgi:hypothetical protein
MNIHSTRPTDAKFVTAERQNCHDNGFQTIEIKPGEKGELRKKWPEFHGLPKFNPLYTSTAILCESMRVFDFDIDDEQVLRQVMPLVVASGIDLNGTIYRTRHDSFRGVFLFRAERRDDGSWPRKRVLKLTGTSNAIDILAAGQQFVAFGPHPSGAQYVWPKGSPRDRPYLSLPVVFDRHIDALSEKLATAGLLARDTGKARELKHGEIKALKLGPLVDIYGNEVIPGSQPLRSDLVENFTANVEDNRITVTDAEMMLLAMRNDYPLNHPLRLTRDDWRDIAFACHAIVDSEALARGDLPGVATPQYVEQDDRLREAFGVFSSGYEEDPGKKVEDADRLWESTRNAREITAGTLVHFARQRILNFPPQVQSTAEADTAPSLALQALLTPVSNADKLAADTLYREAKTLFRQYRSRKLGMINMFKFLVAADRAIARLTIHRAAMMALGQTPMIEIPEAIDIAVAVGDRILGEGLGNPMVARILNSLNSGKEKDE